ncbi:MAG: hypothetical protein M0Q02_05420, partial [Candidatus Muirbacterium halophilum]|nr:hypothetical protein [Candidatus Muirbacterium halophilum]
TKDLFKKIFNKKATEELSELDWKVLRHKEQLELGIETSLTASDYHSLLETKQNIRNKVNTLEQQVNACLTIDEINALFW